MPERYEKVAEQIKELAAEFFVRENNHTSLITIMHATCSPDLKHATVYLTVLPESKEQEALNFAKRNRKDLREFLKSKMPIKTIPFVEIELDLGEKNRQKIDELLREN